MINLVFLKMTTRSLRRLFGYIVFSLMVQQSFAQTESAGMVIGEAQLSCLLEPSRRAEISSQIPGVVQSIHSERGTLVTEGQKVMTLRNGLEKAALESANARSEFARRKYERNSQLLEDGLLSDFEVDELLTERKLGELAVQEAEERLKLRTIYSPIDGLVVKRHTAVGEYVGEEPVMELMDLDPLHAEIVLRGDFYGGIQKGMRVSIDVGGAAPGRYEGIVKIVDQIIDAASDTFGAQVEIPNPNFSLPAGLKCQVDFL
jgi:membrane fusion protein, multidrug efflux system